MDRNRDEDLDPSLGGVLHAIEAAYAVGAIDVAAERMEDALAAISDAPPALATRVLVLAIELRVARGDRAGALALARRHQALLERDPRGATALDLVGARDDPPLWLPDRRPNFIALARQIDRGGLSGDQLLEALARHPVTLLRNPQLHFLTFNAFASIDRDRAAGALSRALRAHGQPGVRFVRRSENVLADLRMERPRTRSIDEPLVSIVVSAFNAEATVAYAIQSLLDQSYRNLEILVCDDGSRDSTWAVLCELFGREPRVRLFRSNANQGTYNVRNELLRIARGDLLTVHDADDLALPSRIERQVRALGREGADASITHWLRITPEGRVVFFRDQNAIRLAIVSLMMTRAAWRAVGPYRPARFGADLELFEDLRLTHRVARDRAPLILGLWSRQSLTRSAGACALEDGYRSPARRAYAELIYRKRRGSISEDELNARLGELGVLVEPTGISRGPAL